MLPTWVTSPDHVQMCAVRTVPYHTRQALDIYRVSERTAETKHSKFAQSFTADMQVRKKVQKCCPLQKASFGASSCPNFHLPGLSLSCKKANWQRLRKAQRVGRSFGLNISKQVTSRLSLHAFYYDNPFINIKRPWFRIPDLLGERLVSFCLAWTNLSAFSREVLSRPVSCWKSQLTSSFFDSLLNTVSHESACHTPDRQCCY